MSAVFGMANADGNDDSRRAQRHALPATKELREAGSGNIQPRDRKMMKTGSTIVRIIR